MAKNYTMAQVLEAVKDADGVMEYVAVNLGCTWATAKKYVDKWEETKEEFEKSECKLHKVAYKAFHEAIEDGERWAIERILDTSARRNGHGSVQYAHLDHTSNGETIASISPHAFVNTAEKDNAEDKQ